MPDPRSTLTQSLGGLLVILQLLLDRLQAGSDGLQLFLRLFGGGEVSRGGVGPGKRGDLDGGLRATNIEGWFN